MRTWREHWEENVCKFYQRKFLSQDILEESVIGLRYKFLSQNIFLLSISWGDIKFISDGELVVFIDFLGSDKSDLSSISRNIHGSKSTVCIPIILRRRPVVMTDSSRVVISVFFESWMTTASSRKTASQLLEDGRFGVVERASSSREEMNRAGVFFSSCWDEFWWSNGVFLRVFVSLEECAH